MSNAYKNCFGGTVLDGHIDQSFVFKFWRNYQDDFGRLKEKIYVRKPELEKQSIKLLYKGKVCYFEPFLRRFEIYRD